MSIREIDKNEVNKLRSCLIQLSEHHNQISTHFNGFYPSKPYEDTLNAFYTSLQSGRSYIAVIENDEKVVDGNDAIRLYEKYGFKMNAHLLWYCEG